MRGLREESRMRACVSCGKRTTSGRTMTYRGKLKKSGGVGRKTVRVNPRKFQPNLQIMTIVLNGSVSRQRVCTSCMRSGRIEKAPVRASFPSP